MRGALGVWCYICGSNVLASAEEAVACVAGKGQLGDIAISRPIPTSGCSSCGTPLLIFL